MKGLRKTITARVLYAAIGSVALTLALGRCSPLASSISKHGNPSAPKAPSQAPPSNPQNPPTFITPRAAVHVFTYETHLVDKDGTGGPDEASNEPKAGFMSADKTASDEVITEPSKTTNTSKIILTDEQIAEFRTKHETSVELSSDALPDSGDAFFQVAYSRGDIEALELEKKFKTTFKPKSGKTWTLKVAGEDSEPIQKVTDKIINITIQLSTDAAQPAETSTPMSNDQSSTQPTPAESEKPGSSFVPF